MLSTPKKNSCRGFTLAELLIAIMILGTIATFTIPKLLAAQQNNSNLTRAKDIAATMAAAFQQARSHSSDPAHMSMAELNLTNTLNYTAIDTSSVVWNGWAVTCRAVYGPDQNTCLRLHSGGILSYWDHDHFCDDPNSGIPFWFSPDGTDGNDGTNTVNFLYTTMAVFHPLQTSILPSNGIT